MPVATSGGPFSNMVYFIQMICNLHLYYHQANCKSIDAAMNHCHQNAHLLAGDSPSGKPAISSPTAHRRLVFFLTISSLLLPAAAITNIAATSANHQNSHISHAILHSTCITARHPELCVSSISSSPSLLSSISSPKDVIHASLNFTLTAVVHATSVARRLSALHNLTPREHTALIDCFEMFDETLDELHRVNAELGSYRSDAGHNNLWRHAADLKILISAAMTNQDSCADGFSHAGVDRRLRGAIIGDLTHVEHLCGNALAMIRNMTDADITAAAAAAAAAGEQRRQNLSEDLHQEETTSEGVPEWMSVEDRRLIEAAAVVPHVTVAADGSGDYRTITEAVAAAPVKSSKRYVIRIMAGTYKENVEVPKKKTNIMFVGDGRTKTVITGSRSVAGGWTTFRTATLAVVGDRFLARDLRVENTAGAAKHQAVALRVGSDLSAFYHCDILGYQDTLYVHSLRQFFRSCLVEGTIDFIFGNAAALLQDCDIRSRRPDQGQKNMITAQGRTDPDEPTGIVLQSCRIAMDGSFATYLGRPWKQFSRTVVMQSVIGKEVHPEGWHPWVGEFALRTLYYGEYQNTGPGSGTAGRVGWIGFRKIATAEDAQQFAAGRFIEGSFWLASTGFPFSLGL
ncbi:hypothetical protein HPP92_016047 [Vanilla planifolia]|uniref:Pectinesterase n=1 Tax=Vanilla planifolia TaxID=51239 RepID=A0A835QE27_VANPL|nr:hypothetical protein HPP92_016645 [Vanilla planifolia]KAG0471501.1 hypothetical protein HPP92_016047 [Vanilla planifolia]